MAPRNEKKQYAKLMFSAANITNKKTQIEISFLRATACTAIARLSHRNSVRLSVCPSDQVDQSKTAQARITKFSPSAAWKTLVLGTVKLFHKFEGGHPEREL